MIIESVDRIEPALLDTVPPELNDLVAEVTGASTALGQKLHPRTAANLADLVRIMNCYYSNLIEGHDTRPRDIERAQAGDLDEDPQRRNLMIEAAAHIRVQASIDHKTDEWRTDPASPDFILWLHRRFYEDAAPEMLHITGAGRDFMMAPGAWRSRPEHDNAVGRHQPPSSERVADFMEYFSKRYRFEGMGKGSRIVAIPAAHHRFNYIHPFPDGNGRVSRLMSHAMAREAGIGAHGLWSISRGLARGLNSRTDYKRMMDHADMPRQGALDGRGNLSRQALTDFSVWFLKVCLDQITFMSSLFDLDALTERLRRLAVERGWRPETIRIFDEIFIRGEMERGDASRVAGLPERSARRVVSDLIAAGLLASDTPKGPVSLRFPVDTLDTLFPRLFAES